MVKIPRFDPIEYLVHREFPIGNGLFAGRIDTKTFCPPSNWEIICCNTAMEDFRKELSSTTPAEIDALVNAEREREKQEAEEEGRRFYNLPSAKADFNHYFKAACWTLEECVALSFGKDPNQVNWTTIKPFRSNSPFAPEYERLRDRILRAKWAGQLVDPVTPEIYFAWAKEHEIALCDELISQAMNSGLSLKSWSDRFEQQKASLEAVLQKRNMEIEELNGALRDAKSEIEALREQQPARQVNLQASDSDKSLGTKERESLLKLVASMAISQYEFDPLQGRNAATKYIWEDMQSLCLSMDEDTVRKYLKQGAELIPGDALENLKPKPNSAKR